MTRSQNCPWCAAAAAAHVTAFAGVVLRFGLYIFPLSHNLVYFEVVEFPAPAALLSATGLPSAPPVAYVAADAATAYGLPPAVSAVQRIAPNSNDLIISLVKGTHKCVFSRDAVKAACCHK